MPIFHIRDYPMLNPMIEIERKRTQSYWVRIATLNDACKSFVAYLNEKYGSKSENFLKSNCIGPSFYQGSGSGSKAIASYVRFHKVAKDEIILFFDFEIKSILEMELQRFNEQNLILPLQLQSRYKPCNIL